jgi:NADH dehydrogenase
MKVVIIGGGFAGLLAAQRLGRSLKGVAEVSLINSRPHFVERVRLHQLASGQRISEPSIAALLGRTARFVLGTVKVIDLATRSLQLEDETLSYDYLFYALGSSASGAHNCADHGSAQALAAKLTSLPEKGRVVVCGGGATGIELVSEIAECHPELALTLVTRGDVGETLSDPGRAYVLKKLARLNVSVRDHEVYDSAQLPCDVLISATSFRVAELAAASGLAVNAGGQVITDAFMRSTSHPEVFAAGDCTAVSGAPVPIRMGCATAMPMAAQAADNLAALIRGKRMRPLRLAYAALFISLGRRDALAQWLYTDDSPRRSVLGGRLAAWLKDVTFRFNMFALRTGIYPWWLLPSPPNTGQ